MTDGDDEAQAEQAEQAERAEQAEQKARQASSFGTQAAAYAEHRPDYAAAAVRWAIEPAAGRDPLRVLDLGAGTGKLTGVIAGLAAAGPTAISLVAVEPHPAMLAELRRRLPGLAGERFAITTMAGDAEHIPLPDESVDAVLAGQAAHWFNMELAGPEIARVLTPGGVFAGLWNADDDSVGWVAGLARVCEASRTLSEWRAERQASSWPGAAVSGAALFGRPEQAEFRHGQMRTADSLVATIATHSGQLTMEPAERDQVLARVHTYLEARPETARGEFRLPLVTVVVRSEKI